MKKFLSNKSAWSQPTSPTPLQNLGGGVFLRGIFGAFSYGGKFQGENSGSHILYLSSLEWLTMLLATASRARHYLALVYSNYHKHNPTIVVSPTILAHLNHIHSYHTMTWLGCREFNHFICLVALRSWVAQTPTEHRLLHHRRLPGLSEAGDSIDISEGNHWHKWIHHSSTRPGRIRNHASILWSFMYIFFLIAVCIII